jgi:WD40 repeat protein/tRNA A-37 threonylcarbamoyl transferase component Bud32
VRVGDYEIVSTVGRGGMGTVLRARAPSGYEVAIKLLNKPEDTARFEREQRLLESLGEEEGFVPLLGVGRVEQGPFIVMPFLAGGTLRDRLERGPLTVAATIDLARALARALGHAHDKGIVHRDLKPENVIFDAEGRPLVADLGLAKHYDPEVSGASRSISLSNAGEFLGTAGYMPLEQARDARQATPTADVFALGAILYECLAGEPAYAGENVVEVLGKLEVGTLEPLARLRPDAPRWFTNIIETALSRDPKYRFVDGEAFLGALDSSRVTDAAKQPRRRLLPALLALVVALTGMLGFAVYRRREPRPSAVTSVPLGYEALRASKTLELTGVFGSPAGRHGGPVESLAWFPDGSKIATGGCEGAVRVWDAVTGAEERVLTGHLSDVRGLSVSPDARRLVTIGGDNTIRYWDLGKGTEIRKIGPLPSYSVAVSFLPDGEHALTVGYDSQVVTWDLAAGIATDRFDTKQERIDALAVLPGGERILTAGTDKTTRLVDLGSRTEVFKLVGHLAEVRAVAVTRDGRHALTGSAAQGVAFWDLETGNLLWNLLFGSSVSSVSLSPDGERAAAGGEGPTIVVWDVATQRTAFVLDTGQRSPTDVLAFSPDGRRLAAGLRDDSIRIWELPESHESTPTELWPMTGHRGGVNAIAVSEDGKHVATAGLDGPITLRDALTGAELKTFGATGNTAGSLAFTRDGKRLLAGGWDNAIRVYEVPGGREVRAILGHAGRVLHVECLPDGKRFVSGSYDGAVKLWDLEGSHPLRTIDADAETLHATLADPAGRTVFTGGRDGRVKRWDLETGDPVAVFDGTDEIQAIALDAAGDRLVADSLQDTIRIWDVGKRVAVRAIEKQYLRTFAVSVLGDRLVSARTEGPLRVNDMATGELLDEVPFSPVNDVPTALAVSRSGTIFVGTGRGLVLRYDRKE